MSIELLTSILTFLMYAVAFSVIVYGEMKYFKYGRPAFYQLFLCGLLGNTLETAYNYLTFYIFDTYWFGFSLTVLVEIGYNLFFFGAVMEMFGFLKEKGVDCSLRRGFGTKTLLLAFIPVALIGYYIDITVRYGMYYPSYVLPFLCFAAANYAAGLIAFRRNDEGSFVNPLRRCCRWFIFFSITFMLLNISDPFPYLYIISTILCIVTEIGILVSLERGSKEWI